MASSLGERVCVKELTFITKPLTQGLAHSLIMVLVYSLEWSPYDLDTSH
jgi:hypothetical protein